MEVQLVCLHLLLTQCDSDLTLGMLEKKKKKGRPLSVCWITHRSNPAAALCYYHTQTHRVCWLSLSLARAISDVRLRRKTQSSAAMFPAHLQSSLFAAGWSNVKG